MNDGVYTAFGRYELDALTHEVDRPNRLTNLVKGVGNSLVLAVMMLGMTLGGLRDK